MRAASELHVQPYDGVERPDILGAHEKAPRAQLRVRGSDVIERCAVKLDLQRGRALFAEAPRPLGTPLAHVTILPVATNR